MKPVTWEEFMIYGLNLGMVFGAVGFVVGIIFH